MASGKYGGLAKERWRLPPFWALTICPANVLGVSCTAGRACRSRSGAAVAANDVRRTEWRTATAVTPSCWRYRRQLGCRAEAGPCQLHTKVSQPIRWENANHSSAGADSASLASLRTYVNSAQSHGWKRRTSLAFRIGDWQFGSIDVYIATNSASLAAT